MKNSWLDGIFSEKGLGSILVINHSCAFPAFPLNLIRLGDTERNIDCKTHGKILFPPIIEQASAGTL